MTGISTTKVIDYLKIGELPSDIQARMKKPSERSESEKKAIETSGVLQDKEVPSDIQARIKKPSERSESEKKAIGSMSPVTDEQIPKNVLTELTRDEDFREWATEKPEKAHKVLSFATKKGQKKVGDVLESIKVEPDLEPEDAYKKTKVEVSKSKKIEISVGSKMNKAIERYVADVGLATREEAIKDIVKDFLKREEYL